jgi:hypothetical protein
MTQPFEVTLWTSHELMIFGAQDQVFATSHRRRGFTQVVRGLLDQVSIASALFCVPGPPVPSVGRHVQGSRRGADTDSAMTPSSISFIRIT